MRGLTEILRDPRRSQRGSVLSGVLIIVAFLSIIASALVTELSTNLLLSRNLLNRVNTEATLDSAVDLSLGELQDTPLDSPCPTPANLSINDRSAIASYVSCWPTVDARTPSFQQVARTGSPFNLGGVHYQLDGRSDYIVANASGTVLDFGAGSTTPRWTVTMGGPVTAPPLVVHSSDLGGLVDVIATSAGGCSSSVNCLSVRVDNGAGASPPQLCSVPAFGGSVNSQPAASPTFSDLVYFASGQRVFAMDPTDCSIPDSVSAGRRPVVIGPMAFTCAQGCSAAADRVYAVVSDSQASWLSNYSFGGGFSAARSWQLPWPGPVGWAISRTQLPASIVIAFAGGGVALVQVGGDGSMSQLAQWSAPAGISGAPFWCHCPAGDLIGVATRDGSLYVLDSTLAIVAKFQTGGYAVRTSPAADGAGDWFFGADDGFLYEVQSLAGQQMMSLARRYGPGAQVGSGVQAMRCSTGVCLYLADVAGNVFMVPLDARDVSLTACISNALGQCSGINPRLWSHAEVGALGNPRMIHVTGWSYYSG